MVSEKGQVTIPKALRTRLGIGTGQVLEFREDHGRLVAEKSGPSRGLDAVYGIIEVPGGSDAAVRRLRGKPDAR